MRCLTTGAADAPDSAADAPAPGGTSCAYGRLAGHRPAAFCLHLAANLQRDVRRGDAENGAIAVSYEQFVYRKLGIVESVGIDAPMRDYGLFPLQKMLTPWALRRGRAAIFADTGLGKSRMQLAWADTVHAETGLDVLILAPLAVAQQTVEEGARIGVSVNHAREADQIRPGLNITNYDRVHKFDASRFGAIALDESSIIKHHAAKTLQMQAPTLMPM